MKSFSTFLLVFMLCLGLTANVFATTVSSFSYYEYGSYDLSDYIYVNYNSSVSFFLQVDGDEGSGDSIYAYATINEGHFVDTCGGLYNVSGTEISCITLRTYVEVSGPSGDTWANALARASW